MLKVAALGAIVLLAAGCATTAASSAPSQPSELELREVGAAEHAARMAGWQTFVGAAGTIGVVVSLFMTANGLKHAASASRAAQDQLAAAREEIALAKQELVLAQDALESDRHHNRTALRAYLIPKIGEIDCLEAGKAPRACIKIRNVGQTPARQVQYTVETTFFAVSEPELPPHRSVDLREAALMVGSGETQSYTDDAPFILSAKQLDQLSAKTHCILVQTLVNYIDVFDVGHQTQFTQHFFGTGKNGSFTPAAKNDFN